MKMEDDANRVKIMAGVNWYALGTTIFFIVLMVGITIYMFINFDTSELKDVMAWILIVVFGIIFFTICAIITYQTATLDKNGIVFKNAIWKIAEVKWTSIVKVDVHNLVTFDYPNHGSMKWIILYTGFGQEALYGGGNVKNKPPWQIIYNKKNARIVKEYLKRYSNIDSQIDGKASDLVKAARKRLGISQKDLARAISVATTTVSDWEKGKSIPNRRARGLLADYCKKKGVEQELVFAIRLYSRGTAKRLGKEEYNGKKIKKNI